MDNETWYADYRRRVETARAVDIVVNRSTLLWGTPPGLRKSSIRPLARRVLSGDLTPLEYALPRRYRP